MKTKSIAVALALAAGMPFAFADTCSSTFTLGTLNPNDFAVFGNGFSVAQSFNDCYNFSLSAAARAVGVTVEWDLSRALGIDVGSISLSGGTLASTVTDTTPDSFSFSGLGSGNYQLAVHGN